MGTCHFLFLGQNLAIVPIPVRTLNLATIMASYPIFVQIRAWVIWQSPNLENILERFHFCYQNLNPLLSLDCDQILCHFLNPVAFRF
jgi:hypothetical protein